MTTPTDPVTRARQLLANAAGDNEDGNDGDELFDMFVDGGGDIVYWPDGDAVAHVYPGVMTGVEPRALAELIAAAPQLISDLCDIIDQHTDHDLAARLLNMSKNGYDPHPHGVLRAAVRKLGGEA